MHITMRSVRSCFLNRRNFIQIGRWNDGVYHERHGWSFIRSSSSNTAPPLTVTDLGKGSDKAIGESTSNHRRDALDLTFNNAEAAFKSKSTFQILRAYMVFTLCSSDYLVENNLKVRWDIDFDCAFFFPFFLLWLRNRLHFLWFCL